MNRYLTGALCLSLGAVVTPAFAANVSTVGSGIWTDGAIWDDATTPAAGNDYFVTSGNTAQSPAGTGDWTFGGDSLTVEAGGILRLENNHASGLQTNNNDFGTLTLQDGARLETGQVGGGAYGATDYRVNTMVNTSGTVDLVLSGGFYFTYLTLTGGVSGSGTVNFSRINGDTYGPGGGFLFNLDATSTFAGTWNLVDSTTAVTTVNANAAGAFGASAVNATNDIVLNNAVAGGLDSATGLSIAGTSELQLTAALVNASAGVSLDSTATLDLVDSASTVGSLTIDGNSVAAGTYDATALGALGYGGTFDGATGTITVVPEPSSAALVAMGTFALIRRRRRNG